MNTNQHLLAALLAGCAAPPTPPGLALPDRAAEAPTGSQLATQWNGLSLAAREKFVWEELTAGNVPMLLRTLVPITTHAAIDGAEHTATFWCTSDYLGVGSDADWLRMPMTPTLAQRLADRLDCTLPTRKMVDAIWARADLQLAPFPFSPTSHDILAVELFHRHHLQIESQRSSASPNLLVAGIKKDVVTSALLASWPRRVCIYGWHHRNGTPIQPLSKVHTFGHVDYSHGIRLVARAMLLDGAPTSIGAVLGDPVLHPLLSDEGPFQKWRYDTDR